MTIEERVAVLDEAIRIAKSHMRDGPLGAWLLEKLVALEVEKIRILGGETT